MRVIGWAGRGASALLLAALTLVAVPAAPSAAAADDPDCDNVQTETEERKVEGVNDANDALHVGEATALLARRGIGPGEGVRIVVVDSGITGHDGSGPSTLDYAHGLTAAGIIAGPDQDDPGVEVGIAPAATVEGRTFYTHPRGSDDGVTPTSDGLATALRGVADDRSAGRLPPRTIVLVPIEVAHSTALESAVDRLVRTGVLVVAAGGDRPAPESGFLPSYSGEAEPGEDAARDVWPAADDRTLAVGASTDGALGSVLRSSAIDVAAPGTGAVSRGLNGGWCRVTSVSSHWAAAQVAGIAALVWSANGDESATRIRARLVTTASGNTLGASPLVGHGVVQALEALERVPSTGRSDRDEDTTARPADAPRARADVLAPTRERAIWWGLGGGGALAVLLILRPVLARRRR
ncbi:hypothetical protein GCM10025786_20450 [Nocardioides caeni]